ncbi:Probable transporter, Major facilitator superfamily protein (MFS) [Oceanicola granulosus HTCC2516]|uniref:Probable transporter, Major facilitator superfamily protein (MFS) n=1 Tax=Oceanicola granulosus (strain ATCC BAA-861 / DSM 15982 / KCTC 12143 / HTCC2516) TaxID=314256 RepID=Q2CJ19_OCEGH|nr:MFS transporter [Oceanicola granulosus]EAR52781.1 Probable transporter, Major facilitator superfamily protein (MFS) [Oceanicola granulosus HTCC2516]
MSGARRTDWPLEALLWAAGLLAAAQFGKLSLTLAALGARYPEAGGVLPFAVSVVGIVGILLGPVTGGLVTWIGLRRAVLGALLLGAGLSLVQAAELPLWLLLVTRAAEGVSHLALVVALPTLMAEAASDRDRPVVMGFWGTFFGVSFALLALAAPRLVGLGGPGALYAAHGGAMALMAGVLALRLPRLTRRRAEFDLLGEVRTIYGDLRLVAPGLIFGWHALVFIALLTFLPAALGQPWLAVVLPLVSLAGTFGAGVLARRFRPARIAAVAFLVNGVLCVAVLALPGAAVGLVLAMFLVIGVVPGAGFAAIPWLNAAVAQRARANGALAQLGNVGTFSGTPLFALALAMGGGAGLIWLTLAVAVAGFATATLIGRRYPA